MLLSKLLDYIRMNNIKFSLNVARALRPALSNRPEQDPKYDHTAGVYDNLK